ncbi:DUF4442 domain-containing protein [bacterium]|nr:DUF4442 domain-containing protein [bacterium]
MKRRAPIWLYRLVLNFWPCIRATGGRVTYLAPDFTRLKVRLKLTWRTRNIVGTIYGGSLYASTDPFYMLMLMEILGDDYIVWDKGCTIRFKKPAKETLFAEFHITPAMLADVRAKVAAQEYANFTWTVQFKSASGDVFTEFDKVLYVCTKESYKKRLQQKATQ